MVGSTSHKSMNFKICKYSLNSKSQNFVLEGKFSNLVIFSEMFYVFQIVWESIKIWEILNNHILN